MLAVTRRAASGEELTPKREIVGCANLAGFGSGFVEEMPPRWNQARERRIGELLRRDTLMFNGYADEVGQLYAGMDLRRNY